jgi:internalin A
VSHAKYSFDLVILTSLLLSPAAGEYRLIKMVKQNREGLSFSENGDVLGVDMTNSQVKNAELLSALVSAELDNAMFTTECKDLRHLDLNDTNITDADIEQIVSSNLSLDILELRGTKITDRGVKFLLGKTKLGSLNLCRTAIGDSGFRDMKTPASFWALYLADTSITDETIKQLAKCTNLEELSLAGTMTGDAGLMALKGHKFLRLLDLSRTQITDQGLTYLSTFDSLDSLYLNNTVVSDAGLANVAKCKSLKYLNLDDTTVSDIGLRTLLTLKNLTDLSIKNTAATAESVRELRKMMPNCNIVSDN